MKKLIILTVAAFVFSLVNAQTDKEAIKKDIETKNKQELLLQKEKRADRIELRALEGKDVSNLSKQQFITDFGDIPSVKWERIRNFDEASFTKDGKNLKAFYDFDSKLVGTASVRKFAELPSNAQKFINEKYKDYSIVEVIFFDDNENSDTDMVLYNQQFDDEDTNFVVLKKDNKKIVLQVNMAGFVYFFKNLE
jgi:hypothetical protein